MSQKGIGRLITLGFAKEATRGTAETSASYWSPFDSVDFNPKVKNVVADQATGVIENAIAEYRVSKFHDGSFKCPVTDQSVGPLFNSIFGTVASATHSGESTVYDHTFTVAESAQHQSLTFFTHDPLGGTDYSYANGVVHKMEIDAELEKFVMLTNSVSAKSGVSQSAFSPSIIAENRFIPQYMTFKYATTVSGLSSATAIALKSLKLTIDESIEEQNVLGSDEPADFLNKEFKVEGQIEAIYQNLTDFKNVFTADPNVGQAMLIDLKNTDVTIGTAANPELAITLNQVYFYDWTIKVTPKDTVYQTAKFRATYKLSDTEMIKAVLTNTVASY